MLTGNINSGLTTPSTSAAFDTIYCAPSTSAGSAAVDEGINSDVFIKACISD